MVDPFIVLCLPRSRSFWASKWLSYPGKLVGHDIAVNCDSAKQFIDSYSNGMSGSVETGAMIGWRLLKHEIPNLKTLVVFRDVDEVLGSLAKFGIVGPNVNYEMKSRFYILDAISACPDVKWVKWNDYSNPESAEKIWEFLLDLPFDYMWWASMVNVKCEINVQERMAHIASRTSEISAMKVDLLARQQAIGFSQCPVFN